MTGGPDEDNYAVILKTTDGALHGPAKEITFLAYQQRMLTLSRRWEVPILC